MLCAYAERLGLPDPFDGLVVGDRPEPVPPPGWALARVKAATCNPHDLWTLKGVLGYRFEPPVILGCDGAGLSDDGAEVVIYPVIPGGGGLRMLTDGVDGTFAPLVAVPRENLVAKPANLTFEEAAGLGTAWLTAYRMLFTKAQLQPGERVLVQGASGGVSTAAVTLAAAVGAHVTVTSRNPDALEKALSIGADEGVATGTRLKHRVDVVIETVGEATWAHTMRSLNEGGRVVVAGATTGGNPPADLNRVFYRQISVLGSSMGSLDEFKRLCTFVEQADLHPPVAAAFDGVGAVPGAMRKLEAGEGFGKFVIRP